MLRTLSKVYNIRPARFLIKLSLTMLAVKALGDLAIVFVVNTPFFRTFPRIVAAVINTKTEAGQHPINPPVPMPYPFYYTSQQNQQFIKFVQYERRWITLLQRNDLYMNCMYNSQPQRENPNDVDHFLRLAEADRVIEVVMARVLQKISDAGIPLTEGINQKIRMLNQWQFKGYSKVEPVL